MTEKQNQALDIIAKVCKKDRSAITLTSELTADLGIDSPKGLQLLMELEETLKISIGDEDAARLNTVDDILNYVDAQTT